MVSRYVREVFSGVANTRVWDALEQQLAIPSPELAALIAGAEAHRFLYAQPARFYGPDGQMRVTWQELGEDMRRGGKFLFALIPWVKSVKRNASLEQLQFLDDLNFGDLPPDGDEGGDASEATGEARGTSASPAPAPAPVEPLGEREAWMASATIPEPAHAVRVLEGLLARYDPRSAAYSAIELDIVTLRHVIDTNQFEAFLGYLDDIKRPHTPTGAPAISVTPSV